MNAPRFFLSALLTFGLLTFAASSQAAKVAKPTDADKTAPRITKQTAGIKKAGLKDLNLTAEQKQKLKELQGQQREKAQALRDEFEKKLEGILTAEQLSKFKELNAKSAPGAQDQPEQTTARPKRKKVTEPAKGK